MEDCTVSSASLHLGGGRGGGAAAVAQEGSGAVQEKGSSWFWEGRAASGRAGFWGLFCTWGAVGLLPAMKVVVGVALPPS